MVQNMARRRPRNTPGHIARFELVVTIATVVVIVAALVVFLVVYHDLPFRIGGP
jgi:hypothetical protein